MLSSFLSNTNSQTVLFDPYMETEQEIPFQVKVDLGVIARIGGLCTHQPQEMNPRHQMQLNFISREGVRVNLGLMARIGGLYTHQPQEMNPRHQMQLNFISREGVRVNLGVMARIGGLYTHQPQEMNPRHQM